MSTHPCIISVGSAPIRLYLPPGPGLQFPWVAFDDLLLATDFAPEAIEFWAARWRTFHPGFWALHDGEMIVPETAAIGLFEAARQGGWVGAEHASAQFVDGSRRFFVELHRDLDEPEFQRAFHEAVLQSAVGGVAH